MPPRAPIWRQKTSQSDAEKFRFQWNPDFSGAYLDTSHTGRKWMAEQDPGIYRLCWCQNDTEGACESLSDFNVSAGQLTWSGPFKKEMPMLATIGDVFEVELSGVGIRSNSVLSIQKDCGGSEGPRVWVQAVQSSTKFFYNFGQVAEDILPPGTYSACWCEPTSNTVCSLAADQLTQVAEVHVRCPLGQFSPVEREPANSATLFGKSPTKPETTAAPGPRTLVRSLVFASATSLGGPSCGIRWPTSSSRGADV